MCGLPIERGVCRFDIPSWGYNSTSKQCEHFTYGGCAGNDNRFTSEQECKRRCQNSGGKINASGYLFDIFTNTQSWQ